VVLAISAAGARAAPLSQGFEDGAPAWQATGMWHVQPDPQQIQVISALRDKLVTLPDAGFLPAPQQGAAAAWFGEAATGTYCGSDYATVKQSPSDGCTSSGPQTGTLTSPAFSLAGRTQAYLKFGSWWEIEAVNADVADLMTVEYSVNGGPWAIAQTLNPLDPAWGGGHQSYSDAGVRTSGLWQQQAVDLSPAAGAAQVRVRFGFDTVDTRRNGFRGLLLDNVAIVDGIGAVIQGDDASGFSDSSTPDLALGPVSVTDAGGGLVTVQFDVTLSAPSTLPVSVDYLVTGSDGSPPVSGTATIPPGQTVITISVTMPAAAAPFTVALSNPVNASIAPGGASAASAPPQPAGPVTPLPGQLVLGARQSGSGPTLGKTFDLAYVSGTLRYHLPGKPYTALPSGIRLVPLGTVVDATNGRARVIVESDAQGTLQEGEFYGGVFGVFQRPDPPAVAELQLGAGDFSSCATSSRKQARRSASKLIRHLWGDAKGRFRTKGRFASATVRGTEWLTEDLCLATRVTVARGTVGVLDFRRHTTTPVRAGQSVTVSALQSARYRKRRGIHSPRLSRA